MNKGNDNQYSSDSFETKESINKTSLNKYDYDLFNEEADVVERVVRIKRFCSAKSTEKWKVFENTKILFIIEGNKLTKKEKEFLRTINGVNWLIAQSKDGADSFNYIKKELKKAILKK